LFSTRDLGFAPDNILLLTVDAAAARTPAAKVALLQSMLDAIGAAPGVRSASYADQAPSQRWSTRPASARGSGAEPVIAERNEVGPGYLQTLGLTVLHGRDFDPRMGGQQQAIVNQHLADALWPGESPLGRTITLGNLDSAATIIGVAPNALIGGYRREDRPAIVLLSAAQTQRPGGFTAFHVRFSGSLETAVPAITRAMREAAPSVPVTYIRTMETTLHEMTWMYRTLTMLLVLFAGGSLFIAALGQYAAMAFAMRQRIRDFAIRMAMGASSRQILAGAVREGLMLTAAGLALGGVLGVIAGRGGRALLHGVTPTDATTYAGVLLVLGAASLTACYVPALRASRIDPIDALRSE
jgi:predicted lysophospholipase L1 biosynthesis ABC-type transport system permease subunit